jgi:hypothetical protein
MPQCQFPVFCYFCVSEKLHRKYSQNWTKQKPNLLFLPKLREDRRWHGGGPGARLTKGGARPSPWPPHPMVRPAVPTSDDAFSPIKSPRREKNLWDGSFFLETYCKPPPSSKRDREDPGAPPGTLTKRGIPAGGLLHHHGCLRSDVWVVYLGLRVHSISSKVVFSALCFMFRSCELPYMIEIIFM